MFFYDENDNAAQEAAAEAVTPEGVVKAESAAERPAAEAEEAAPKKAAVDAIESITEAELRKIIETVLFITDKPVPLGRICAVAEVNNSDFAHEVIKKIQKEYLESGSSVQIIEVGGGYQMSTKPEFGRWVRRLYGERMSAKLSAAALETLAIVAYRQPITRAEMEAVRGVDVIGPLETLIERGIVKVVGRKETIGRPLLYGTTAEFLRLFGLSGLKDLPTLESFGIDVEALEDNKQPELFELPDNTLEGLTTELNKSAEEMDRAALTELELAARDAELTEAGPDGVTPEGVNRTAPDDPAAENAGSADVSAETENLPDAASPEPEIQAEPAENGAPGPADDQPENKEKRGYCADEQE